MVVWPSFLGRSDVTHLDGHRHCPTVMIAVLTSIARETGLKLLTRANPVDYERSRNDLDGAVTRLSPFLRHGVLSLAEVRDFAIAKAGGARRCHKLIQELAWRDYFQRVWQVLGTRIWQDIEPYKTGFRVFDYADELPNDLLNASTGVDYIDAFVEELHSTGYLHNHARLWLAAYVVHGRRVTWQAGAKWFLAHLLDGDEASNNLSWQWVASTFSAKPYFYNRENVQKYSGGRFAEHQPNDPFDGTYEAVARKLFRDGFDITEPQRRFDLRADANSARPMPTPDPARTLVWVQDRMMSPDHPAVALGQAHLFVWDDEYTAAQNQSAGRLAFQASALFCRDVHSSGRSVAEVVLDAAKARRLDTIVTGQTPDPRLRRTIETLSAEIDTHVVPERPFVELSRTPDLARFSRYWSKAEKALF